MQILVFCRWWLVFRRALELLAFAKCSMNKIKVDFEISALRGREERVVALLIQAAWCDCCTRNLLMQAAVLQNRVTLGFARTGAQRAIEAVKDSSATSSVQPIVRCNLLRGSRICRFLVSSLLNRHGCRDIKNS